MAISSLVLAAALTATPVEAPTAATEAAAGVEAYRAFFTDGYDRKRPTVSFERRPNQTPKVVVYSPDGTMEGSVSTFLWATIQDKARFADRQLAPLAPEQTKSEVVICTHAWGVLIELINSPESHERAEAVRSARQHMCAPGLTTQFGYELARLAVDQLPACATLKGDNSRNDIERLALCARFSADEMAAASLASQIGDQLDLRAELPEAWRSWMGRDARPQLNWSGQIIKDAEHGENRVGKFLAAQERAWIQHMWARRFEGIDARHARVTGIFTRLKPETSLEEQADYEQVWTFDSNGQRWALETWRVGEFGPRPAPVKK